MAGTISSTTKFTPITSDALTADQKEQFAQWLSFSRMNGIDAIPDVGYNDYQPMEGYTPHVNMRYVNQGEVLGISLTLQMESNNEDADMMELRKFFGMDETLKVVWNSRNRAPSGPAIGASTAITGSDPGTKLPFGQNLYQMHGNYPEGTELNIPGVGRFIAVPASAIGGFGFAWKKV